ncbi:chromate transporter [Flavobacterium hibisci]|uniref:chromate transporter n=1 Tax=Flavobacterium hibisci TaxID=1914462 RepID=UPI001CBE6530|nr:chromate transporter [Flavobacterium hibisci]MBZ4044634.1 chromate transporter [Flavobacterium hibisci]
MIEKPTYTLRQLVYYFFKLGMTGFGGPVALVGYMHEDLVEKRKWVSEENYKEGLALAQLAPGPLAAQLGIYLGFLHYRILGATLAGLVFIIPSFIIVLLLSITYTLYGGLSWLQAIFYGVGAAVIGIIVMSSYKLTQKSIGKFTLESLKNNWVLWIVFGISLGITLITKQEHILLFICAGLVYMAYKSPGSFWRAKKTYSFFMLYPLFFNGELTILEKIAIFFIKAGAFVFGSGLAIIPFLYAGVVAENHWLTEQQFLDAVAIAMITPGPVVITVAFIGYIVAGFSGACVSSLATFLPCYLFTVIPAPYFHKIAKNESIKNFVTGITAAVVGALVGAVVIIASRSIVDISTALIAILTIFALIFIKKIAEPVIILIAAFLGILIKLML